MDSGMESAAELCV
jgi:hypothetical protein